MSKGNTIFHYRLGRLGKSTILSSAGLGIRALIQAAYLLLISRWLGAEGYGLFAGIVAFFSIATPLANWGSNLLTTQYISENRKYAQGMWATALVQSFVIGTLLTTLLLIIAFFLLPQKIAFWSLLLLAFSELILLPASHAASSQCFALEHGNAAALSVSLVPFGRLLIILIAIFSPWGATPALAATAHFIGTVIGFILAFCLVAHISGLPTWKRRIPLAQATRQGAIYAVSNIASTSYLEIDKIIMLQLLSAIVVGPYTVAFRVASIFVLPFSALTAVFLPRMMAQYSEKIKNQNTIRLVIFVALGYGILACLMILLVAPFISWIFGLDYKNSTYYLQLMAIWPMLFGLRQTLATWLTAQKKQRCRSWIEILGLILITVLNLILLPQLGAEAAIITLLVTEVLVSLMMCLFINR